MCDYFSIFPTQTRLLIEIRENVGCIFIRSHSSRTWGGFIYYGNYLLLQISHLYISIKFYDELEKSQFFISCTNWQIIYHLLIKAQKRKPFRRAWALVLRCHLNLCEFFVSVNIKNLWNGNHKSSHWIQKRPF